MLMHFFLRTPHLVWVAILLAVLGSRHDRSRTGNRVAVGGASLKTLTLLANASPNELPFTIEFVEKRYRTGQPLPRLQGYVLAPAASGDWLIVGGRRQGLHTFAPAPATNFVRDSANHFLYVINPVSGQQASFDVNKLPPTLAAPLQATNQQQFYDPATDQLYIVGGYGWKADKSDMVTFNTIMRMKVADVISAIRSRKSPAQLAALIQLGQDDRLAVTGGDLFRMRGVFYLVFGQRFDGQYRAFGGSNFKQTYTEEVRVFTLVPNTLTINSYGATTNTEPDRPFHRRDGNNVADVDPATGKLRIMALGGVFKPGIIGAYTYPVFISGPGTPTIDRNLAQKFSQYSCPVIAIHDSSRGVKASYHTFFGGISHYYYAQTASQKAAFDLVTKQGRNDGFPFVADITTVRQRANGTYSEFIHPAPIPGNRLLGSSVPFVLTPALITQGYTFDNGVVNLARMPVKKRLLIGYIYGGIEAQNPLPLKPNTGTFVSNSVFAVYLTRKPSAAIPADQGHESVKQEANLHRE